MNLQPLLDDGSSHVVRDPRRRSPVLKTLAGLAVVGTVATLAITSNPFGNHTISTWLMEPKDEFNWNVTDVLSWNTVNHFSQVSVAPSGDLYAIQKYDDTEFKY